MTLSARFPQFPSLTEFRQRLDVGALIFAPYIVVFVWQYFSVIRSNGLTWALAVIVSLLIWYISVATREAVSGKLTLWFWPIVALPLLLIFLMRVAFPDISFDVLNYHVFQSERALRGPLFIPGDFFPTGAPFNPTADILTGLYRQAFGYRLGSIANYVALIWTGAILDRLLRDYIRSAWVRSLSVLFVLCTEQIFFQINDYMVDLLALPLLLEATILAIKPLGSEQLMKRTWRLALLLGMATAFKLANLFFAVPIVLFYFFYLIRPGETDNRKQMATLLKSVPLAAVFFILPSLPFLIFIYRLTGNPVFPVYNSIFKSPFWPQGAVLDPRWGPNGLLESLSWPIIVFFKPERFCELPVYSGRMSLGVIAALICAVVARKDGSIRALCFITVLGALLWSAASGYSRYAIFVEVTSGIIIVRLVYELWTVLARFSKPLRWLTAGVVCLLLLGQVGLAFAYGHYYEWSMRAPLTARPMRDTLTDARELLRDRDLRAYLSTDDQLAINNVDAWIETTYKTTAFMALLKPDIPALGARTQEYFVTKTGREKFDQTISATQGKRLFTLTEAANLQNAREVLAKRGLTTGSIRPFSIPYFSRRTIFDMLLVEVIPASREGSNAGAARKGLPLADRAFNARIRVPQAPLTLPAGAKYVLDVSLENASNIRWPGQQPTWQYQITVGNRWFKEDGQKVTDMDGRAPLADDLPPAMSATLRLTITAPATPGEYVLELDAIQEGVAWFSDRGSATFRAKVRVN